MPTRNQIHHIDAFKAFENIENESIDLIVTDPPYGIAHPSRLTVRKGKVRSTAEVFGSWDTFQTPLDYDVFIGRLLIECHRVLKPGGALYLFLAREQGGHFVREAVRKGFRYRNTLALCKSNPLPSFAKTNWRSAFDLCLYLVKGPKAGTFNFGPSQAERVNVYTYPINGRGRYGHPTEKPVAFLKRLVEASSEPGDLVLDPFTGSGTTAAACKLTGRDYLGFEINKDYVKMARQRLKDLD